MANKKINEFDAANMSNRASFLYLAHDLVDGKYVKVTDGDLLNTAGAFTANRVIFANNLSKMATSNNFQFDGTTAGLGTALTGNTRLIINGLGTTSGTSMLFLRNSDNTKQWLFRDDGAIRVAVSGALQSFIEVATSNNNLYVGRGASASGSNAHAFGNLSNAGGANSVALGYICTSSANNAIALGYLATSSGDGGIAIGNNITASGNMFAVGGGGVSGNFITALVFNNGNTNVLSFSSNLIITPNNSTGTNVARSGSLILDAGAGTGNAVGMNIDFRVAPAGTSGSLVNSKVIRLRVRRAGDGLDIYQAASPIVPSPITDGFVFYSNDVSGAGTASPHFLTENNKTIKLYQQTTAVSGSTYTSVGGSNVQTNDTFDGYTIAQVVKVLRNLGILE